MGFFPFFIFNFIVNVLILTIEISIGNFAYSIVAAFTSGVLFGFAVWSWFSWRQK